MAFPIMTDGKLEGVLALQIYSERVFQVVTDNVGLGASGETVITRLLNERTALVMAPAESMSPMRRWSSRYRLTIHRFFKRFKAACTASAERA